MNSKEYENLSPAQLRYIVRTTMKEYKFANKTQMLAFITNVTDKNIIEEIKRRN